MKCISVNIARIHGAHYVKSDKTNDANYRNGDEGEWHTAEPDHQARFPELAKVEYSKSDQANTSDRGSSEWLGLSVFMVGQREARTSQHGDKEQRENN